MRRNIIKLGEKTYVVSLPSKWVDRLGLKKKDELEVAERGDELIISSGNKHAKKTLEMDLVGEDSKIVRYIFLIAGSLGYDEIIFTFKDKTFLSKIQEMAQKESDFVLVGQTKDRCHFKMVSREEKEEFDYLLEKTLSVTLTLGEGFNTALQEKDFEGLKNLLPLERTNNRLTTLCQRILIKTSLKEQDVTCFAYVLLWNLEAIADFYRRSIYLLDVEKERRTAIQSKTLEIINQTTELLYDLYSLSKNIKMGKIAEVFNKKFIIGNNAEALFEKGKYIDRVLGHYMMDINTYIQDCAVLFLGISSTTLEKKSKTNTTS